MRDRLGEELAVTGGMKRDRALSEKGWRRGGKTEGCSTASKSYGAFEGEARGENTGGPLKNSGIFGAVPGVDAPDSEKMRGAVR